MDNRYTDRAHYQTACQSWLSQKSVFEEREIARLQALKKRVREPRFAGAGGLAAVILAIAVGVNVGSASGWSVLVLCAILLGFAGLLEEKITRFYYRDAFVRRTFNSPRPVLVESNQGFAPPPSSGHLPKFEDSVVTVTSMRQAFEILEIAPGRITLSAAKSAYHKRMAEYHPDKVSALGRELQSLAARKALSINLAWKFIQGHCKRR